VKQIIKYAQLSVIDTLGSRITFDSEHVCDHCNTFFKDGY